MTEFTNGELKLLFQRIDEKLDDIKGSMSAQHSRFETELLSIKNDIKDVEEKYEQTNEKINRIMTIGGTIWAVVTLISGFILNRIF